MAITLEGQVHLVHETEQKTETFRVREMILTVDPASQYPAYITIQVNNDKETLFDGLQRGQNVRVHVNLNGRLYDDKKTGKQRSFNSIVAWKVDVLDQTSTPPPTSGMTRDAQQQAEAKANAPKAQAPSFDDGEDDMGLPF